MVLRALHQGSFLALFRGLSVVPGMEPGTVACKADGTLPAVLSLWSHVGTLGYDMGSVVSL